MKPEIKKVEKFEWNGKLYDSEEEVYEEYQRNLVQSTKDKIGSIIVNSDSREVNTKILEFITKISNDELKVLRKLINQKG